MNVSSSTTSQWLKRSTEFLVANNITTARLDCLVLLEDFTGKDRSWLLAHADFELEDTSVLDKQIERRAQHEPLAYIRGKSEFYGREFKVNNHTLEPRPETETMIDLVKTIVKSREKLIIADIGTGSGCIAISVKLELPMSTVIAIDKDVKCVKTARENSLLLGADVKFYECNLLQSIKEQPDMLLCNLPYVPAKYQVNQAAKFEPKHALFGGEDGLDIYRELFIQITQQVHKPTYVLAESLPFQHDELTRIALSANYKLDKVDDFIQVFSLNA